MFLLVINRCIQPSHPDVVKYPAVRLENYTEIIEKETLCSVGEKNNSRKQFSIFFTISNYIEHYVEGQIKMYVDMLHDKCRPANSQGLAVSLQVGVPQISCLRWMYL